MLDPLACDRARIARDWRFDGQFFTGVKTTGIYCRPICPVKPARSANVCFFASAAAAERAGFRPCLRCCPEAAPGTLAWDGSATILSRALQLVDRGYLDEHTVAELAGELTVGGASAESHLCSAPRCVAASGRPYASRPDGQTAADRNGAADHANRVCLGLLERASVQRRLPRDIRSAAFADPTDWH